MLWLCGRSSGPEDLIDLMFEGDTVSVTYDGGLSRPLKLTATEAMTLAVALRTLTDVPGATQSGAAERALAKIETAAGQHLDTAGVDIRLAAQDRWVNLAQRAVSDRRAVDLRYYTAARDESTHRIERERARYTATHAGSKALFDSADHLFGRVPMTWMTKWSGGFPLYLDTADGARVTDVDGNSYADFALGDTGAMAGHSPAPVAEAIRSRAIDPGT